MELIKKLELLREVILTYRNWIRLLWTYYRRNKSSGIIVLKSGVKYEVKNIIDGFQIINEIYIRKIYDLNLVHLSKNPVILDVGANVGTFSVFMAKKYPEAKIYSYEPCGESFSLLNSNIVMNSVRNIKTINLGIGSKNEKRRLYYKSSDFGSENIEYNLYSGGDQYEEIKTIDLKKALLDNGLNGIDYLKLDCEGAEFEILYSASDEILNKIKTITMEYHELYGNKKEELMAFLVSKGFRVKAIPAGRIGMIYARRDNFN